MSWICLDGSHSRKGASLNKTGGGGRCDARRGQSVVCSTAESFVHSGSCANAKESSGAIVKRGCVERELEKEEAFSDPGSK